MLTFLFRIIPKFGPFKALKIRTPTPEVEKLFMASFNTTVDRYRAFLANADADKPVLPNENLDLGVVKITGKYKGAGEAYAKLVGKLAEQQFNGISPDLRENILAFYKDARPPKSARSTEKEAAAWAKLQEQLDRLSAVPQGE